MKAKSHFETYAADWTFLCAENGTFTVAAVSLKH